METKKRKVEGVITLLCKTEGCGRFTFAEQDYCFECLHEEAILPSVNPAENDSMTGDPHIDEVFNECIETMRTKSLDYSQTLGDGDRLFNFREAGKTIGLPMRQVLYVYMWKHLAAIAVYCKTGKVESEGIRGRIVDAMNYLAILYKMTFEDDLR